MVLRASLVACSLLVILAPRAFADASVDGAKMIGDSCGGIGLYPTRDRKTPSGPKWQTGQLYLLSAANANDRYTLIVRMEHKKAAHDPSEFLLCLPGRAIPTGSGGSDDSSWSFEFAGLDRATADEVTRRLHVARKDRRRLGEGLRWRYHLTTHSPRVGDPLPLVLTVENLGKETVVFTDGGGHRGSDRENRFRFAIVKEGVPQPDVGSSMNFGGLAGYVTLAPGQSHDLREVDLKMWGAFAGPGRYEVRCAYDLDLTPSTTLTWATGNERWDLPAEETIEVPILP